MLLVAGDVFDTGTPSNRAQQLYYRFLCRVADAACPCRHVVVIAGNHDSPSFLDAPRELLKALDVHVIGSRTVDPEDEVLVLRDRAGLGRADRLRRALPARPGHPHGRGRREHGGQERKLTEGIRDHYAAVAALAEEKRSRLGADLPIVAMGHLFAAGGQTMDGDGVRELYIGSPGPGRGRGLPGLFRLPGARSPALPQLVDRSATSRYSGSPTGHGLWRGRPGVCRVRFAAGQVTVAPLEVPVFQQLERIQGDLAGILDRLETLTAADSRPGSRSSTPATR